MSIFGFSDDPIWPWAYEAPGSSALGKAAWKAAGSHFCWLIRPLATGGFEYAEVMARGESPMTAEGQHSGPLDELVEILRARSDLAIFLYPATRDASSTLGPLVGHGGFLDVAGELQPLQRLYSGELESWVLIQPPTERVWIDPCEEHPYGKEVWVGDPWRIEPGPADQSKPRHAAREDIESRLAGYAQREHVRRPWLS